MSWAVAATTCLPVVVGVRWWRRRHRTRKTLQSLREAVLPAAIEYQTSAVTSVAEEARLLCLLLEAPILRCEPPLFRETPWGRRQRCEAYDIALGNLRRDIWEFTLRVVSLDSNEKQRLFDMGLSLAPIRRFVFLAGERSSDVWEDMPYPKAPQLQTVEQEIWNLLRELRRFEQALRKVSSDPYRGN